MAGGVFAAGGLAPLALLLVQWWRGGRVTRLDLLRVAPLVVLGALITAADLAFCRGREPLELGYTLAERMLTAGRALLMGRAWREMGDIAAAVEQYERSLRIEPRNVEALDHLARARFGQRRFEDSTGA